MVTGMGFIFIEISSPSMSFLIYSKEEVDMIFSYVIKRQEDGEE
jgi:hypothetical protein